MIYTMENIEELQKVQLHDYELVKINVDYIEKKLTMICKSPKGVQLSMYIDRFYYLLVQGFEPWGEGFYIYSHQILKELDIVQPEDLGSNIFGIELLINSGDKVIMYGSKILVE